MVEVERRLDAGRIHRSVWRCSFAESNTNADANAYSHTNADAWSVAACGVAEQHAGSARKPDRRQSGCCVDAVGCNDPAQRHISSGWPGFSTAVLQSHRLHIRHRFRMVAVERQFMDTNRRSRSVWRCSNSNSNSDAYTHTNSDADTYADADRRVAQ